MEPKTWREVILDHAFLISIWITGQFFVLIVMFSQMPSKMDPEAKTIILQTYVVAFTAAWGYFLGSSSGSKAKDQIIAGTKTEAPKV